MRMRDPGKPLDPRIAADLATVDRSLSGLPVEGGDADLAELALLLRDERPASEPRWAAELDERAAAGFPRGGGGRGPQGPKGRRGRGLSWLGGGGWMVPAGARRDACRRGRGCDVELRRRLRRADDERSGSDGGMPTKSADSPAPEQERRLDR